MMKFVGSANYLRLLVSNLNREIHPVRCYSLLASRAVHFRQISSQLSEKQKVYCLINDLRWSSTNAATPSSPPPTQSHMASPSPQSSSSSQTDETASVTANSDSLSETSQVTVQVVDAKSILKGKGDDIDLSDFIVPEPPKASELIKVGRLSYKDFDFFILSPRAWICEALLFLESYMPSSAAIILSTFIVRLVFFPFIIRSRRVQAETSQVSPKITELMSRRKDAVQMGDDIEVLKCNSQLSELYKNNPNLSIKKMALLPVISGTTFTFFFLTLRHMAKSDHEPMKDGGFLSFSDLTYPDSSYLLQSICAASVFISYKLAGKHGLTQQLLTTRSLLADFTKGTLQYLLPVVAFFATGRMPSAFNLYWATNNIISIIQSGALLIPGVRKFLKIPQFKKVTVKKVDKINWRNLKNEASIWWNRIKVNRELKGQAKELKTRYDRSGSGPIRKTFDYDPTKIRK